MTQNSKNKSALNHEQRKLRFQRILFVIVSVILILSWILVLVK